MPAEMSSLQRRKSIEPGTAASRAAESIKLQVQAASKYNYGTMKRHDSTDSHASAASAESQKPSRIQAVDGLPELESHYVVPPMSSVSVDPPIPAETESRSAQDQHPMRTSLPLLCRPLLPAGASHVTAAPPRPERPASPNLEALPCPEDLPFPAHPTPENVLTSATTTTPTSTGPHLLTLPPEIRHLIYLQLPYMQNTQPLIYGLSIFKHRKQHPLASICRQIRGEALGLFYSTNTWLVSLEHKDFYDAFVRWITALPDPHANSLRLLKIRVMGRAFSRPRPNRFSGPLAAVLAQVLPSVPQSASRRDVESAAYGCATFSVDLSERWHGGKVVLVSCDGPWDVGLLAQKRLEEEIRELWRMKKMGLMTGRLVQEKMENFLTYTGWWL